jgi:hypothetical protein
MTETYIEYDRNVQLKPFKARTLYIRYNGNMTKFKTFMPDNNLIRRANEMGMTLKSATEHTVTLDCKSRASYLNASKF